MWDSITKTEVRVRLDWDRGEGTAALRMRTGFIRIRAEEEGQHN